MSVYIYMHTQTEIAEVLCENEHNKFSLAQFVHQFKGIHSPMTSPYTNPTNPDAPNNVGRRDISTLTLPPPSIGEHRSDNPDSDPALLSTAGTPSRSRDKRSGSHQSNQSNYSGYSGHSAHSGQSSPRVGDLKFIRMYTSSLSPSLPLPFSLPLSLFLSHFCVSK